MCFGWTRARTCVWGCAHVCVCALLKAIARLRSEAVAICTETLLLADDRMMAERLLGGLWVNVPTAPMIVCPLCLVTT